MLTPEMLAEDGGSAFPSKNPVDREFYYILRGMSMRDYFAARAMEGLLTDFDGDDEELAHRSYMIADAMLEARERRR